jgi:hypothetical protein
MPHLSAFGMAMLVLATGAKPMPPAPQSCSLDLGFELVTDHRDPRRSDEGLAISVSANGFFSGTPRRVKLGKDLSLEALEGR